MAAITHIGNKLLITRGELRGRIGEIIAIIQLPCGLTNYEMIIGDDTSVAYTIPAEDCREYCPGSINLESPFDITNYLSVEQMKDIAETIYAKKITDYINDIIHNQKIGGRNFLERVIDEIIRSFAKEYLDQYKDQLLETFKKVIEMDVPVVDDEDAKCFGRAIQWALERCATNYIEKNPDEITEIMKPTIHHRAGNMLHEKWSYTLSKKVEKFIDDFINESLNTTKEDK